MTRTGQYRGSKPGLIVAGTEGPSNGIINCRIHGSHIKGKIGNEG
jgi:hypothetical protein